MVDGSQSGVPGGRAGTRPTRRRANRPDRHPAELIVQYPELVGLRPRDLPRTAASRAVSYHANIKVVQRMLGHKTASITLDRYGHLYAEDLANLADALDEKFRGAA